MTSATDPENTQKPTIGSVMQDVKAPIDSTQHSIQSSKPASIRSEQSFKSVASQPPATAGAETPVTPIAPLYKPAPAQTAGPVRTPLTAAASKSKPSPPAALTADQQTKYSQVLATVSSWKSIPNSTQRDAVNAPITEDEQLWLSRECLLRYLRATKWKVPDALKRLQNTLSWRREYGADTFTAEYISPENETGKQVILGYDNDARPCLYLNPGKQNTKNSDRQIHHLSYMLDRVIDMMGPGQETTALLINFKGASSGNTPSVNQARQTLTILQSHNPERLGRALISELPWYVSTFFKIIAPLIDPVTREKMKFNEDLRLHVPPEQLWKAYGGDLDFEYDHKLYWPALDAECNRRREAYKARWVQGGKRIGEYEAYLRGGEQKSIQQLLEMAEQTTDGVQVDGTNIDIGRLKV